ncbi:MAG: hypothetical protein Q7U98_18140 [Methylicorpusculum sp.]|uniref:hypothetical protein n=1 Tax=Methylicorpusculum sp. TaxID=2713644 RepID=UPI0027262F67|nr:hypothetical protein [Methylicorpusculum sp.]MDO8941078.1 hypothetical protein [Methylicorpusculum sp.]MDP2202323.1 hypothetical protein [Methylicorpusculum sp.]
MEAELIQTLTKDNADFTEWYAVLCFYVSQQGHHAGREVHWSDSYQQGLTPEQAWASGSMHQ